MRMPETCWAVSKRQVINLRSCCILLVDSVERLQRIFDIYSAYLSFPFFMYILFLTIQWEEELWVQIQKLTFLLQSYKFCMCMQIYSTAIYFELSRGLQCSAGAQIITALFAVVSKLDIDDTVIIIIINIINIVIIIFVNISRKNSLLKFYISCWVNLI
jgi:hypothetical protein